ncbi:MAG: membrane protein insertion efficiency factor YidD [bacterium]|nr:membrane protein insertion efficiency factor YidD [bacterium]
MKKIILKTIKLYQATLSSLLHSFGLSSGCRFYPTCSHYSHEAFNKYGVVRGFFMSAWRILRCNPISKGGVDLA